MSNVFEIELPTLKLDEVYVSGLNNLWVMNRAPAPNESSVPVGSTIEFDLLRIGPAGYNPTSGTLTVDGVLAYDWASGPQNGFQVTVTEHSSYSGGATDRWHFVVRAPQAFPSLANVGVVAHFASSFSDFPTSWSFRVQDLTRPEFESVKATSLRRIRVIFSEKVTSVKPESFAINYISTPAVDVSVIAVEEAALPGFEGRCFDLSTDTEMTPSAEYSLSASGVADLFGNEISSTNSVSFVTMSNVPAGRKFDLWDLMPEMNKREDTDGELRRFLSVLQESLNLVLTDTDRWTDILDPHIAAEPYLDLMLEQMGNPFPFELSEIDKRRLVDVLVQIYKEKGTEEGIRRAVRFFLGLKEDIEIETLDENLGFVILGDSSLGENGPTKASLTSAGTFPLDIPASSRLVLRCDVGGYQQVVVGGAVSQPGPFQVPAGASISILRNGALSSVVNLPAGPMTAAQLASAIADVDAAVDALALANGRLCIASRTSGESVSVTDSTGITFGFTTKGPDVAGKYSAERLAEELDRQLAGISAEVDGEVESGFRGPYKISDGMDLELQVNPPTPGAGAPVTQRVELDAEHGNVDDLVAHLAASLSGVVVAKTLDGRFRISSATSSGTIRIVGGTAMDVLGLVSATFSERRLRVSSDTDGTGSQLEVQAHSNAANMSANAALQLPEGVVEGAGHGFELWPGDRVAVYSFNVVCPTELTDEQRERLIYIVNYMKPAHTHLAEVIVRPKTPKVNHLVLGLSRLGRNWLLH